MLRRSRIGRLGAVLGVALMLVAGCGSSGVAASPTWATVNGHPITKAQVVTRVGLLKVLSPSAAAQLAARSAYVSITQELANEYLLTQAAQKAKVTVTKQQTSTTESELTSYLDQSYGSTAKVQAQIKKAGITQADLTAYADEAALLQAYLTKVVKVPAVTSQQISAYYKANPSQFQTPEEYDLRHILVKTQALAQSILQQLQKGASFQALAKKYSIDTGSAQNGGDLGYAPLSTYVTPFAQAAAKLTKPGQLSGIVHSQFGYHIIQLVGIKAASTQTLAAATPSIKSQLAQQALQTADNNFVNSLSAKAKIKLMVPKKVP